MEESINEFEKIMDQYIQEENFIEAEKIGAKFPNAPKIQSKIISIYIKLEEYEKAKEIGLKFPEEEKIQSQMIKIYMKEGNYVEAIKLGAEFPENPIIQSQMMSVYMRQGKYYRAKRIGEKFSWHKPIQLQLGKIYNILGQPKNDKPQIERNNAKIDNDTNKATNEDTISMESREILEWIETSQRTEAKSIVDEIKKQNMVALKEKNSTYICGMKNIRKWD